MKSVTESWNSGALSKFDRSLTEQAGAVPQKLLMQVENESTVGSLMAVGDTTGRFLCYQYEFKWTSSNWIVQTPFTCIPRSGIARYLACETRFVYVAMHNLCAGLKLALSSHLQTPPMVVVVRQLEWSRQYHSTNPHPNETLNCCID